MLQAKIRVANQEFLFGFRLDEENHLELVLPAFYQEIPKNTDNLFFDYYKLFQKYRQDILSSSSIKEEGNFKNYSSFETEENIAFSKIEAFFSLLKDYNKNGLLLFQHRTNNLVPKGKINWRKTRQKGEEILQDDGILYLRNYYKNLRFNYQHPITLLHACAIQNVLEIFGLHNSLPFKFQVLVAFENNYAQIQNYLRLYEREMYSDRERKIFSILKSLYLDVNSFKQHYEAGDKLFYAPKLDLIWEKMLKTILLDEYKEFQNKIPKGNYNLNASIFSGLSPIPDIIIQHKGYLMIIDAKNYHPDFDKQQGMPASSDIGKQIMYKFLLSKELVHTQEYSLEQIINIFLLPADLSKSGKTIKYLGKHSLDKNTNLDLSFGDIFCFQVDFETVKNDYLTGSFNVRKSFLDNLTFIACQSL